MKCQICKRREARHTHEWHGDTVEICGGCRRRVFPTPAEADADDLAAERLGEYRAESGAGCFDLP